MTRNTLEAHAPSTAKVAAAGGAAYSADAALQRASVCVLNALSFHAEETGVKKVSMPAFLQPLR
jgi:hypothetical protein